MRGTHPCTCGGKEKQTGRASALETGERGSGGRGGGDEHVRAAAFSILFVAGAGAERLEAERHALLDSLAAVVV